jgi:hypothetical protein
MTLVGWCRVLPEKTRCREREAYLDSATCRSEGSIPSIVLYSAGTFVSGVQYFGWSQENHEAVWGDELPTIGSEKKYLRNSQKKEAKHLWPLIFSSYYFTLTSGPWFITIMHNLQRQQLQRGRGRLPWEATMFFLQQKTKQEAHVYTHPNKRMCACRNMNTKGSQSSRSARNDARLRANVPSLTYLK